MASVPAPLLYVAVSGLLFLLIRGIFNAVERKYQRRKPFDPKLISKAKGQTKATGPA